MKTIKVNQDQLIELSHRLEAFSDFVIMFNKDVSIAVKEMTECLRSAVLQEEPQINLTISYEDELVKLEEKVKKFLYDLEMLRLSLRRRVKV